MNQIDPNLLAAGIGAVAGTNFMATDNDPIALVAGAGIGGGVGYMMDFSKPSDLDLKANRSAQNTFRSIDEESVGQKRKTFNETKEEVRKLALSIANKKTGDATYNRENPYSSLNKKSFGNFLVDLDNIQSSESLTNLKLSLLNKTDHLFINEGDISKKLLADVAPVSVIKKGASLDDKVSALREELVNIGYKEDSAELNIKLKRLTPLLELQEDVLKIGDGKIDFGGEMGSMKLTYQSVSETGEVALQAATNRNIYDIGRVNIFGSAILNDNLNIKAVADGLGITMANLFNLNKQMGDVVEGLAPDDAAGLFAHVTKDPKQVGSFINKVGDKATYNEVASGQYKENLMRGSNTKPSASPHSVSVSNSVDYSQTFNINDNGVLDRDRPLRKLGIVSENGRSQSEIKSLISTMSKRTGAPFVNTSTDHATQLPRTEMTTFNPTTGKYSVSDSKINKVVSVAGAWERNLGTINNRSIVHDAPDLPYKQHIDEIVEGFGGKFQYAAGMPMQTIGINPKAELSTDVGHSKLFADFLADAFGSDVIVSDGYGVANTDITNKISTSGNVGVSFKSTADNKYIISDPNFQKIAKGEMTFEELKEQAQKGISRVTGKAETKLKDTKRSLVGIAEAVKEADGDAGKLFETLKRIIPSFKGYTDIQDAIGKGVPVEKQIEQLQKKAVRSINSLVKPSSLYKERSILMPDSANEARQLVQNSVSDLSSSNDLKASMKMIEDILEQNNIAKKYISQASSFYPKAKQVLGYNADGSPIALKQNYAAYEFLGMFSGVNQDGKDTSRTVEALFKGKVTVGSQETFKSFAIGTKAQFKNISSDFIAKTAFLSQYVEEGNFKVDPKTNRATMYVTLEDGKKAPISFSPYELNHKSMKEIFHKNGVPFTVRLEEQFDRLKQVGAITEDDSSGLKIQKRLLDIMTNSPEKIESTSTSKILGKFLTERVKSANGDQNVIKSLVDFSLATSNDKASTDFLLTSLASVKESASHKLSIFTNSAEGLPRTAALSELQAYARDVLQTDVFEGKTIIDPGEFNKAVSNRLSSVMQYFGSEGFTDNFYDLSQDRAKLDNLADFFIQERKYRPSGMGDTLLRMVSANRIAEQESGSGKNVKNMSWNMIEQLKMNGFNDSDMNLLGKVNSANAADYKSVSMLTRHVKDTVNSQITEGNQRAFKEALVASPDKRRELLTKAGVKIDDQVGAYKLSSQNEFGIKNLPILLEESMLFGSYTDNKTGEIAQKKIHSTIQEAISADLRIQNATTQLERDSAQHLLDSKLKYINETITPLLGGSGNLAKRVMSRTADSSLYSLAAPVAGSLRKYSEQTGDKHIVSVSSKGLLKRLNEAGMKFDSIEDVRKAGLIKDTGYKGLSEVFYDKEHKLPMFGFMSREPAVGMGSATTVRYMLDENIKASGKMLFSAFDNPINSLFKFKDFDFDHVLEVFPKIKGTNFDQLMDMFHVKGKAVNNQLDELIDFARVLGVKGKDRDKLKTFFDLIDKEGVVDRKTFMDAFLEDTATSRMKGQDRKTISPAVTKLSADLNHAIMQNGGDEQTIAKARVMGHYFVENLLKSMHTGTEDYKKRAVTLAEELSYDLMKGNKDRFNTTFGNFIEDSIVQGRIGKELDGEKKELLEKQVREAYKYIQNSVSNHSFSEASTPMHLKRPSNLTSGVQNLVDVVEGAHTSIPVSHVSEELIMEGNEQSLVQRGKVGYHKASEIIKHNIMNNKKLLGGGLAATIGAALLTQKKPDYGNTNAHANTSGMLLKSSRSALEDTSAQTGLMGGVQRATEYMHLYGNTGQKSVQIDGFQTGQNSSGNFQNDVNNFMFGDGMSSVRILNS